MPKVEAEGDVTVNEYEGAVLGVLARVEPATRYRLLKSFKDSPTTTYSPSNGSLYPLVARLVGRGLIQARAGVNGREKLALSPEGRRALARWIAGTGPQHLIADDPLLLRVLSLGDLEPDEQVRWIIAAKAQLLNKKDELSRNREPVSEPYSRIVHDTTIAIIKTKLEWLDRLLIQITKDSP